MFCFLVSPVRVEALRRQSASRRENDAVTLAAVLYVLAGAFCWTMGLLTSIRPETRRHYLRLLPRFLLPWGLFAATTAWTVDRSPLPEWWIWPVCGLSLVWGLAAAWLASERAFKLADRDHRREMARRFEAFVKQYEDLK